MRMQIFALLFVAICSTAKAQSNSDIPNTLLLGKEKNFTISKATLTADPVLRLSETYKNYRIISYQISYVPMGAGNVLVGPFVINGNTLTTGNAADILQKTQPGDRIFLEEVVVVNDYADNMPLKLAAAIQIQ